MGAKMLKSGDSFKTNWQDDAGPSKLLRGHSVYGRSDRIGWGEMSFLFSSTFSFSEL